MKKKYKRINKIFLILFLFALITSKYAFASESVEISQTEIEDGQIKVYINGIDDPITKVNCLIASRPVKKVTYEKYNEKVGEINTLILIDSSKSIQKEEQKKFQKLILDLIDNKNTNESIAIATYGQEVNYLCDFENDRYEILKAFEKVKYKKQTSYLTDIVAKVTNDLNKSSVNSLTRIIIFSDGYDNNPDGLTKEELYDKLEETPYPIYTIGCEHSDNKESLKELFALSRVTGGKNYRFNEKTKNDQLRRSLEDINYWGITVYPVKELQDGSIKTIEFEIKTSKETFVVNKDIRMNMAEIVPTTDPNIQIVKEPVETKSFFEKNLIAIIAVSILVFIILCIIGVLIWDKKRKENKILTDINNKVKKPDIIISGGKNVSNQEYSSNIGRSFVSAGDELDKTVVLHQEETIFDRTIMLMPENSLWSIKLKDIRNNRIFVKELGNELILGRVGNGTDQSRIVIDYETSVSKRHCRIYIKNKDVYIMDMGSSNHTFVNDKMIEEEHLLKDGDVIGIGNLKLEVSLVQLAA